VDLQLDCFVERTGGIFNRERFTTEGFTTENISHKTQYNLAGQIKSGFITEGDLQPSFLQLRFYYISTLTCVALLTQCCMYVPNK